MEIVWKHESSAKSSTKNAVAVEVSCKVVMASARTAECNCTILSSTTFLK